MALGAFEFDSSPSILTQGLSGLLQENIKCILTSFAPVVYCSSQANISLNYKYLCIALYLRADDMCVYKWFLQLVLPTASSTLEALTKFGLEGFP